MNKLETIKNIKNILKHTGCFSIGELDYLDSSPCIRSFGSIVVLLEYFTEDYVEANVYQTNSFSSEAIGTYDELYDNLNEDILDEIYLLCQEYEAQTLKTEKRISN